LAAEVASMCAVGLDVPQAMKPSALYSRLCKTSVYRTPLPLEMVSPLLSASSRQLPTSSWPYRAHLVIVIVLPAPFTDLVRYLRRQGLQRAWQRRGLVLHFQNQEHRSALLRNGSCSMRLHLT